MLTLGGASSKKSRISSLMQKLFAQPLRLPRVLCLEVEMPEGAPNPPATQEPAAATVRNSDEEAEENGERAYYAQAQSED